MQPQGLEVMTASDSHFLGWMMRARMKEAAGAPPSQEEALRAEIRDLLKERPA